MEVSKDFVVCALQARYDNVVKYWGCDASEALWNLTLDYLLKYRISNHSHVTPMYLVDNYLVNGDFITRGEEEEEETDQEWDRRCGDAIVYNEQYACLSF